MRHIHLLGVAGSTTTISEATVQAIRTGCCGGSLEVPPPCAIIRPVDALELKVPPPVVAFVVAVLIWVAPRLTPSLPLSLPVRAVVAAVPAIMGAVLGAWAMALFLQARTTIEPMKPYETCVIVDAGVYRLSRNPMYLGITLLLVSWAVVLANPAGLLLVAAFPAYITRFQIVPEERILAQRFGETYEAYRRRVPRWM